MAPPRPAAAAGAADEGSPEALEVRCAGCGETLEVEPGLTEFICPGCATPQSLPPELMPPPPQRRKALPLPHGAADVRGARLPCGACGALLSVPVGLPRCACPVCGTELAVDTARLREYLLSYATAEGAVPVLPSGTSAQPILQARVVHTKRPDLLISEQAEPNQLDYMIDGEEIREVNEVIARHNKQRNGYSVGPGIVSVEKRQEPLNQVRHQAQDQCPSYPFCSKQTHLEHSDRIIEAGPDSITPTRFREPGCIAPTKETSTMCTNCSTGRSIAPQTVNVEKRKAQTHTQMTQQAQKQPSYYVICSEHTQPEYADGMIHVQEKQREPVNKENHTEDLCTQLVNETIAGGSNRRTRHPVDHSATGVKKRQVHTVNDAIKQVQQQQSDSVIHMELENQLIHVEKEQLEPFSCRTHTRKTKGLIAASNRGVQLRRSKRLAKDSPAAIDKKPDKNEFLELQASPNDQVSTAVFDAEPTHRHWKTVDSQAVSSIDHMPADITDSEPTESEPDELYAASPDQSLSDSPDIDGIIKKLCTTSSPRHEMPQTSSNKLDNLHLPTLPPPSHLDMSDPQHFSRNYVPIEVRKALAKLKSSSLFEHMMSQASSGDACLHDLTDSEGDDPCIPTHQNVGIKRNQGRGRGATLCLKVWSLPKGVRIPVPLNTLGEPVGKEAGTLTNFLGTIARDGILAPLVHRDWRCVPEKNKDVMCCIVKLKFDISSVGEFWILKSVGKKWRSWKAFLKQKHYDAHETEEERLADRNPRVLEEQWQFLVTYWSTEKAKAATVRNKACQAKVATTHTAGRKSFARIIEEERQKRPNKDELSPLDVFILTHAPKNGKPIKKTTADIISRLREQSHKKTEDSGNDSTVRNFGLVSCTNGSRGKAALKLKASFKQALEAKRKAEDEAAMLRKKMEEMEESRRKLQEDLANTESSVSARHEAMPIGDLPDKHMHNTMPVSDFPDELAGGPMFPPGFPQNPHSSSSMPRPKRTKR